jgi:hypothetical protein
MRWWGWGAVGTLSSLRRGAEDADDAVSEFLKKGIADWADEVQLNRIIRYIREIRG